MRNHWKIVSIVALLATIAAADTADEDFLFRLAFSLDRASNYSSTAALQATTAYPRGSSVNPATDDLLRVENPAVIATMTHLQTWSESGAWLTATSGTASLSVPEAGTFTLAYARTDTIDDSGYQSREHSLTSNEFFAGYSRRLSDTIALGLQFRYLDAEVTNQTTVAESGVELDAQLDHDLDEWSFSVGIYVQIDDQWSFGLAGGYAFGEVKTDVLGLGPAPPFPPPGTLLRVTEDDVRLSSVRTGLGYRFSELLAIYGDASYLHIETDNEGSADQGRFALGVEWTAAEAIVIRSGVLVDTDAEVTFSAGLGLYMFRHLPIDIAYQYNAAPEVKEEFGRFHLLTLSVVFRF